MKTTIVTTLSLLLVVAASVLSRARYLLYTGEDDIDLNDVYDYR